MQYECDGQVDIKVFILSQNIYMYILTVQYCLQITTLGKQYCVISELQLLVVQILWALINILPIEFTLKPSICRKMIDNSFVLELSEDTIKLKPYN